MGHAPDETGVNFSPFRSSIEPGHIQLPSPGSRRAAGCAGRMLTRLPAKKADNAQENGRGHSFPSTARANRGARMGLKKKDQAAVDGTGLFNGQHMKNVAQGRC